MTYLISGILIFVNFISSLIKGKGSILKVFLLMMMWILFWGNYNNPDYFNYTLVYDYILDTGKGYESSQLGFSIIMGIALNFGFEYYQFLMIISFLGLYLIASTVEKYTSKPQLVYVLYFLHPFLLDIVQVRHFLAMSIIIFCIQYLEKNGKLDNMKFIFGILIAFSIHYISIIFLPLILIKRMKIKRLYIVTFVILVVGIPLAYSNILQGLAFYLVPIEKVEIYFSNRARYGFVIQFFIQGVLLAIIHYSKVFLEKHNKASNTFVELIYKINIYLLILFPLYTINGTFERAFRMITILNYIVFSLVFSKIINKKKKGLFVLLLLLLSLVLFIYYIFIPLSHTVFFPIFEYNLLFK